MYTVAASCFACTWWSQLARLRFATIGGGSYIWLVPGLVFKTSVRRVSVAGGFDSH